MMSQTSFRQRWRDYRPSKKMLAAACAASVFVTLAVGFGACGWVSGDRAATLVAVAAGQARTELAARMCETRFLAAPDSASRLSALRQGDPWYRGEMLEDAGWTKIPGMPNIPGSDEPVFGAADRCATLLTALPAPTTNVVAATKPNPALRHAGNS